MAPLLLLVNVSKIVGVASVLTVAVNTLAFRHFRKKNLASFENPIDEDEEVLATFPIDKAVEDGGFFFALATAPAHVEDKLNDAWLEFAKQQEPNELENSFSAEQREVVEERKDSQGVITAQKETKEPNLAGTERSGDLNMDGSGIFVQRSDADKMLSEGSDVSDFSGRHSSPLDSLSDWEVVGGNKGKEKQESQAEYNLPHPGKGKRIDEHGSDASDDRGTTDRSTVDYSKHQHEKDHHTTPFGEKLTSNKQQVPETHLLSRQSMTKSTTEEPTLQFNLPKKRTKFVKVAMEAMIRGLRQFSEGDEDVHTVAAWENVPHPEERVRFWSDPDTELRLAQGTNVTIFRMGVDWSRIMPAEPVEGIDNVVNWEALNRYRWILERVHAHGMRVMLTLFHHSLPSWAAKYGGWKEGKTIDYFLQFTRLAVEKFANLVDYWVTFNEPHVFAMLTYCAGAWPGGHPDLLETATAVMPRGVFNRVMVAMAEAHLKAYDIIHEQSNKTSKSTKVGIAHHVSFMRPYGLFDVLPVFFSNWKTRFAYVDSVCNKLDYIGINYYGQEVVSAPGLKLVENEEYSESGRGVCPDGLYRSLLQFHERYKNFNLPFIITENGVSDETDYIRRPYILEHLLAVRAAMDKGVPVQGYCFWTTSDNWEWADGYGPKFGLAAVDREHNLARIPRPSYYLFSEVAKSGKVTREQRVRAWDELQTVASEGKVRPFYRAVDQHSLMYAGGLDVPIKRPFAQRDWRFGHYQFDGLQDPLSSAIRFLFNGARIRQKVHFASYMGYSQRSAGGSNKISTSSLSLGLPAEQFQATEQSKEAVVPASA
ncbi:hypothetical protein O6H91_03G030700 [Diphasiastrum complanatum]|nr:hypothetical protein O6H91_03G030700 [Diphasiastrum complanatum]KAJ7561490.1 hypothetical protein O6H91_03G030700 [Diphasiastrum complanatum]KAJ7561491.1 hypothetical protein O6H91_03G030700 [Diphasiastrum complanatum]KAJ7561498.1 hypothetical protein O6H91_03G030700 [Diphasiastrum complanatum]